MRKRIIGSVLLGGALTAGVASGLAGASVAVAAAPTTSTHTSTQTGQLATWLRAHRKELRRAGLQVSAKTIGITSQELVTELKAGNSIAGVATQHQVDPQTVINALVGAADDRINQAVAGHRLTSTQASTIEAQVPARVTKIVDHTF